MTDHSPAGGNHPRAPRTRRTPRSTTRRSRLVAVAALAVIAVAASCAPPPAPPPAWSTTRLPRTASTTEVVNRIGAWTDQSWFATVRAVTPIGGSGTAGFLDVYPRSGRGGSVLGTPQSVPIVDVAFPGPVGQHVIALPGTSPFGQPSTVRFYRPVAGVWGEAGSAQVPADYQVAAMTDDWMVARPIPDPNAVNDGAVLVFDVDTSGAQVTATQVATLGPDPSWPQGLRAGFGVAVGLDGGLLAVAATSFSDPVPGAVRVFRTGPGGWAPVQSLGGTTGPSSFRTGLAVDDGPTVDRVVMAPTATSLSTVALDVLADSGSGFVVEQSLRRNAGLPDESGGTYWGAGVAIDGPTLAVTSRSTTVPSVDTAHPPVTVGQVQIYRRGGSWYPEREVRLAPSPYDAGVRSAFPDRLKLAGTNLAASVFVNPDEPPGCTFPCFVFGFEAWSIDRL